MFLLVDLLEFVDLLTFNYPEDAFFSKTKFLLGALFLSFLLMILAA